MVLNDFSVCKSDTMPWIVRIHGKLYKTKEEAQKAVPYLIESEIREHQDEITRLERLLGRFKG
jgi:hypothetical protein